MRRWIGGCLLGCWLAIAAPHAAGADAPPRPSLAFQLADGRRHFLPGEEIPFFLRLSLLPGERANPAADGDGESSSSSSAASSSRRASDGARVEVFLGLADQSGRAISPIQRLSLSAPSAAGWALPAALTRRLPDGWYQLRAWAADCDPATYTFSLRAPEAQATPLWLEPAPQTSIPPDAFVPVDENDSDAQTHWARRTALWASSGFNRVVAPPASDGGPSTPPVPIALLDAAAGRALQIWTPGLFDHTPPMLSDARLLPAAANEARRGLIMERFPAWAGWLLHHGLSPRALPEPARVDHPDAAWLRRARDWFMPSTHARPRSEDQRRRLNAEAAGYALDYFRARLALVLRESSRGGLAAMPVWGRTGGYVPSAARGLDQTALAMAPMRDGHDDGHGGERRPWEAYLAALSHNRPDKPLTLLFPPDARRRAEDKSAVLPDAAAPASGLSESASNPNPGGAKSDDASPLPSASTASPVSDLSSDSTEGAPAPWPVEASGEAPAPVFDDAVRGADGWMDGRRIGGPTVTLDAPDVSGYRRGWPQAMAGGAVSVGLRGVDDATLAARAAGLARANRDASMVGGVLGAAKPLRFGAVLQTRDAHAEAGTLSPGVAAWAATTLMAGFPFDVVYVEDLTAGRLLAENGRPRWPALLFAGLDRPLDEAAEAALSAYIEAGGDVYADASGDAYPNMPRLPAPPSSPAPRPDPAAAALEKALSPDRAGAAGARKSSPFGGTDPAFAPNAPWPAFAASLRDSPLAAYLAGERVESDDPRVAARVFAGGQARYVLAFADPAADWRDEVLGGLFGSLLWAKQKEAEEGINKKSEARTTAGAVEEAGNPGVEAVRPGWVPLRTGRVGGVFYDIPRRRLLRKKSVVAPPLTDAEKNPPIFARVFADAIGVTDADAAEPWILFHDAVADAPGFWAWLPAPLGEPRVECREERAAVVLRPVTDAEGNLLYHPDGRPRTEAEGPGEPLSFRLAIQMTRADADTTGGATADKANVNASANADSDAGEANAEKDIMRAVAPCRLRVAAGGRLLVERWFVTDADGRLEIEWPRPYVEGPLTVSVMEGLGGRERVIRLEALPTRKGGGFLPDDWAGPAPEVELRQPEILARALWLARERGLRLEIGRPEHLSDRDRARLRRLFGLLRIPWREDVPASAPVPVDKKSSVAGAANAANAANATDRSGANGASDEAAHDWPGALPPPGPVRLLVSLADAPERAAAASGASAVLSNSDGSKATGDGPDFSAWPPSARVAGATAGRGWIFPVPQRNDRGDWDIAVIGGDATGLARALDVLATWLDRQALARSLRALPSLSAAAWPAPPPPTKATAPDPGWSARLLAGGANADWRRLDRPAPPALKGLLEPAPPPSAPIPTPDGGGDEAPPPVPASLESAVPSPVKGAAATATLSASASAAAGDSDGAGIALIDGGDDIPRFPSWPGYFAWTKWLPETGALEFVYERGVAGTLGGSLDTRNTGEKSPRISPMTLFELPGNSNENECSDNIFLFERYGKRYGAFLRINARGGKVTAQAYPPPFIRSGSIIPPDVARDVEAALPPPWTWTPPASRPAPALRPSPPASPSENPATLPAGPSPWPGIWSHRVAMLPGERLAVLSVGHAATPAFSPPAPSPSPSANTEAGLGVDGDGGFSGSVVLLTLLAARDGSVLTQTVWPPADAVAVDAASIGAAGAPRLWSPALVVSPGGLCFLLVCRPVDAAGETMASGRVGVGVGSDGRMDGKSAARALTSRHYALFDAAGKTLGVWSDPRLALSLSLSDHGWSAGVFAQRSLTVRSPSGAVALDATGEGPLRAAWPMPITAPASSAASTPDSASSAGEGSPRAGAWFSELSGRVGFMAPGGRTTSTARLAPGVFLPVFAGEGADPSWPVWLLLRDDGAITSLSANGEPGWTSSLADADASFYKVDGKTKKRD